MSNIASSLIVLISTFNKLLENKNFNSVVSVHKSHDFYWSISKDGTYKPSYGANRPRRQDFSRLVENGSIFVTRSEEFIQKNNRIVENTTVYEIPIDSLLFLSYPLLEKTINFVNLTIFFQLVHL